MAGGPSGARGRSASVRPSAFPGRATKQASLATLRSWGAWPPILLRFVVARRPGAWSVCRACALARIRAPVAAPGGAGNGGRGGARRAGSAASPPGRRGPFRGKGKTSLRPREDWRAGAPVAHWPEGRVGGRGEGGPRRGSSVPCPGGLDVAPGPVPRLLRRTPPGYIRSARVAGQPCAPGAASSAVGGSAWRLGELPPRRGAHPGGSAGSGAGRSLCRGLFPRLPRTGTKAGRSVRAPPSMLHFLVSPSRCGPRGALEGWRRAAGRQRALRE